MNKKVSPPNAKMAAYTKEHYEGSGMKTIVGVYEDPTNAEYVDAEKTKKMFTKVIDETNIRGFRDGGSNCLSYFFAMGSSRLGQEMRDNPVVEPYVRLHKFIEGQ